VGNRRGQPRTRSRSAAQSSHRAAGFLQTDTRVVDDFPQCLAVFGSAQAVGKRMQLHGNPGEALYQSVVQFACDSAALGQNQSEPAAQLFDAELIDQPYQQPDYDQAQRQEPNPLIKEWRDFKVKRAAGFVAIDKGPASHYMEAKLSRWQIGVERLAPRTGVSPAPIIAFQHVAVGHSLGR